MIVCLECGHHNDEALEFCESCGTFLEWEGQEQRDRTDELATQRDDTDQVRIVGAGERAGAAQLPAVCPRCGEPGRPGLSYCPRCGLPLERVAAGPAPPRPAARPPLAARPWWRSPWVIAVAVLAIAGGIVWLVLRQGSQAASPDTVVLEQPAVTQPASPSPPAEAPPGDPVRLDVVDVTASSVLGQAGDIEYDPRVTLDGDPTTAWNDGVRGDPTGESLEYRFASPVRIARIELINGYDKVVPEGDRFTQNARIRAARFVSDAGERTSELQDTREPQSITIDLGPTCRIELVVDSIYPGAEFEDVALSEISFFGTVESEDACPAT